MSGPHSVFFLAAVNLLLPTSASPRAAISSPSPPPSPSRSSCLTGKSGFTMTRFIGSCKINRARSECPLDSGDCCPVDKDIWTPRLVAVARWVLCVVVAGFFANGTTSSGSVQTQERLVKAPRSCGVTCTVYRHKRKRRKKKIIMSTHSHCTS